MAMTIAVMGHRRLNALIKHLAYSPPSGINLRLFDGILKESLEVAMRLEAENEVDVFVTAGGNYDLLSRHLKTPLVEVKITGFDFLLALQKARGYSPNVAVITYRRKLAYLDEVLGVLPGPLRQVIWNSTDDVAKIINSLVDEGVTSFIGASLVCDHAEAQGLAASFIYSEDGVMRALDTAIQIALAKRQETAKAEELRTILNFAYEGIIATDSNGTVTVFNPIAEKITGISRAAAVGRFADDVIPGGRLKQVIKAGQPEVNQLQSIGNAKILTNRIPLIAQGEIVGAVATFRDVGMIQEAEEKIREKLYEKGFIAKNTFADIIGRSKAIAAVKSEAALYAKSDSTILILGKSGTGKELFAQAIHNASGRIKRPFVAINCAALPPTLLESELFGYEEGAFTGAKKGGKRGLFELAHGGTIFLDEIGEMPMPIQSRLLRILEEHEVLRIGGERILPVDIRVIAATNKDLWELVQSGGFREDLYYRLSVLELKIPSLIKRKEDIPFLVEKFLGEFRRELPADHVAKIARHPLFTGYDWPGNVRQLRNVVERFAVLYSKGMAVDTLINNLLGGDAKRRSEREAERLAAALAQESGNKAEVAKRMGISRTTLWRKLRQFNQN